MAPPALFAPLNAVRNLLSARAGEALVAALLAVAFLFAMVWDDLETSFSASIASILTNTAAESVVLSFTHAGSSAAGDAELVFLVDFDADNRSCELAGAALPSRLDLAAAGDVASLSNSNPLQSENVILTNFESTGANPISLTHKNTRSKFAATYRSIFKFAA